MAYELFCSIILGIVEGLTEFLPVSSTGHMLLVMPLLGVNEREPMWQMQLWASQFAAILAVILWFWRDLWRRIFHPISPLIQDHILTKLFVAMVPTVAIAVPCKDYFEVFERPIPVAIALILGAFVMEFIDRRYRHHREMRLEDVTLTQAFLIGLIQTISMWPGVSRSAATILGGMALGLSPRVSAEFTFYLAIPTMLGATLVTARKYGFSLGGEQIAVLIVGCVAAFLVALAVVATFLQFVKRTRFTVFSVYRVALGMIVLVTAYLWSNS
jgi:undecaprenyl-diphosphatase